jgi:hypothetical protein
MQNRRLITVLALIAFLPVAAGCSTTRTVPVGTDPAAAEAVAELQAGAQVKISGYTRTSDGYHDWNGEVRMAAPDSLEFIPASNRAVSASEAAARFRLPSEEVASLTVVEPDTAATVVTVIVSLLAVGAVVTAIVAVGVSNSFDGMDGN